MLYSFNAYKIIIIVIIGLYISDLINNTCFFLSPQKNLNFLRFNSKKCNHVYEYSKIEKLPTKEKRGRKIYICKFCRSEYIERIPKLSKKNYKIGKLISNCENGNVLF